MSRGGQTDKKLAVLEVIRARKDALFPQNQNDSYSKKLKEDAWREVLEKAKEVGIASQSRTWTYARDLFTMWKKSTMAKQNSANSGSRISKATMLDAVDEAILDILESESSDEVNTTVISSGDYGITVTARELNQTVPHNLSVAKQLQNTIDIKSTATRKRQTLMPTVEYSDFDGGRQLQNPSGILKKRKTEVEYENQHQFGRNQPNTSHYYSAPTTTATTTTTQSQSNEEEMEDLRKQLLVLEIYKAKLEALKLERELRIPYSEYTREIVDDYMQ